MVFSEDESQICLNIRDEKDASRDLELEYSRSIRCPHRSFSGRKRQIFLGLCGSLSMMILFVFMSYKIVELENKLQQITTKLENLKLKELKVNSEENNVQENQLIPRRFIFVVEKDMIEQNGKYDQLVARKTSAYNALKKEWQDLVDNMQNTLNIHKCSASFYDFSRCEHACEEAGGTLLKMAYIQNRDLTFKSDICRGCALYLEGGYYSDWEMVTLRSVFPLIHPHVTFSTAWDQGAAQPNQKENPEGFFQSFLAADKGHPIIKKFINDVARDHANNNLPRGHLGPIMLRNSFEEYWTTHFKKPNVKDRRTYMASFQLFQEVEVKFGENSEFHEDPTTLGATISKRKSWCNFVVYDPSSKLVPFQSRLAPYCFYGV